MSLLPSSPDAEPADDAGPRVIGVDSDDADQVLAALSSGTARQVLAALHDEPAPPSALADEVDTSLQNVQYHLEKLQTAGAVEVVDTAYSAKGREMDVYAPADQPLVIFAGDEDRGSTLKTALTRLLGALGILGLASLAVQALFGRDGLFGTGGLGGGADGGDAGAPAVTPTPTPVPDGGGDGGAGGGGPTTVAGGGDGGGVPETVTPQPTSPPMATSTPDVTQTPPDQLVDHTRTVTEGAAAGLPPGLLFFAGGVFVLSVVALVIFLRRRA